MIVFIIALAFLLGMLLMYLFLRKRVKALTKTVTNIRVLSVEKLCAAYDEIEKLKKDNKVLLNQLNSFNNENRNNNRSK